MKKILKRSLLVLSIFASAALSVLGQQAASTLAVSSELRQERQSILSKDDEKKLFQLKEFVLSAGFHQHKTTLPTVWDNEDEPFCRPLFNQAGLECGQASAIGLGFTYELNYMRGTTANIPEYWIPTHFVWNFQNRGGHGVSYLNSWEVLQQMGSPNFNQYGGMSVGTSATSNYYWPNGYDIYYQAMQNRAGELYQIKVNTPEGLETLKYWLYNHADTGTVGGLANFYASSGGAAQYEQLPIGTPQAGKYVRTEWGGAGHAMTILGWNDSICFDYNNDGMYTNNIDINGDNKVDMQDWEKGGLRFANTFANPGGYSWLDSGCAYMMYATLAKAYLNGGIWNNTVHVLKAKESYDPLLTMKIKLTHTNRSALRISAGVANDLTATVPEYEKDFLICNNESGDYPMQGTGPALEFGLDISELLNYVSPGGTAKYFLVVTEKDPNNTCSGMINYCSIIDYSSGAAEYYSSGTNIAIADNSATFKSLNASVNFSDLEITSGFLNTAYFNIPFEQQLLQAGGTPHYSWELCNDYNISIGQGVMPMVSAEKLILDSVIVGDDSYTSHALDFQFPFYGELFDTIVIYNNCYVQFVSENSRVPYDRSADLMFKLRKMIAPYLFGNGLYPVEGDSIWFEGDANYATIRWNFEASTYGTVYFNIALILHKNGNIDFFYDPNLANSDKGWIGGISNGDYRNNLMHEYSGSNGSAAGKKITFTPRVYPHELKLSSDGLLYGTLSDSIDPVDIKVMVTDNTGQVSTKELRFFSEENSGVLIDNVIVQSGGDNQADYTELAELTLVLANPDSLDAANNTVTLTSADPFITILDDTEELLFLAAQSNDSLSNAFSFMVASNIPDEHEINFNAELVSPSDTINLSFMLTAYTAVPEYHSSKFVVGSGNLPEPGDNGSLEIDLINSGGSTAKNIKVFISSNDPYITINSFQDSLEVLAPDEVGTTSFLINTHPNTPVGHAAMLNVLLTADHLMPISFPVSFMLGEKIETWETPGGLFNWLPSGDEAWFQTSAESYEGATSYQSGHIDDNEISTFKIVLDVISAGEVSFYTKTSYEYCTNGECDRLAFFIDGVELHSWIGFGIWHFTSFPVDVGTHVLEWSYIKNHKYSYYDDCAWVDNISLPPNSLPYGEMALNLNASSEEVCQNQSTQMFSFIDGVFDGPVQYTWSPADGLNDITIPNPIATPQVSTEYTLSIADANTSIETRVNITVNPSPLTPVISFFDDSLFSSASFGNQWFNNQGAIPGAVNQVFVPQESGNYFVVVVDSNGCVSDASNPMYFELLAQESPISPTVHLYPNPFKESVVFGFSIEMDEVLLEIFNTEGALLRRFDRVILGPKDYLAWDGRSISGDELPAGTYHYKIQSRQGAFSGKIIKL